MRRHRIVVAVAAIALAALGVWIVRHIEWVDTTLPMPLRGEAARNPVYAAQRFAEALGARTERGESLELLPTDGVLVLSAWSWDVSSGRRERLEQWVEAGGRLVVDRSLLRGSRVFEDWSGIRFVMDENPDQAFRPRDRGRLQRCAQFTESGADVPEHDAQSYELCDFPGSTAWLESDRPPLWMLRNEQKMQAVRVAVGDGSVAAIDAEPFVGRELFEGDHGALFVAAAQLRAGDEVVFLSEQDHSSLLTLIWRYGAPVVVIASALLGLALWRGAARFGPLVVAGDPARRSLAEQIRGTGQFALRFGGGAALHAAAARALDEAAARRIPGWSRMSTEARAAAVARCTGIDRQALEGALAHSNAERSQELRSHVALLETARRRILHHHERIKHGQRTEHDHARG